MYRILIYLFVTLDHLFSFIQNFADIHNSDGNMQEDIWLNNIESQTYITDRTLFSAKYWHAWSLENFMVCICNS